MVVILIVACWLTWVILPFVFDLMGYAQKEMDVYEKYIILQRIRNEKIKKNINKLESSSSTRV